MLTHRESNPGGAFPIVGIGSAAGGIAAFVDLLRSLPGDTGLAFVLIQNGERTDQGDLLEALGRATPMTVGLAVIGAPVEPNHVYVIPLSADVALLRGRLEIAPRSEEEAELPIDRFMRSLAAARGCRAIGVILSGSVPDGTAGLRAIRAAGGITFAQDPLALSDRLDAMPRMVIEANVVDYCLPVRDIAKQLARLSRHAYMTGYGPARLGPKEAEQRHKLFEQLHEQGGIDFNEYNTAAVTRRIARRLALRCADDLASYLTILAGDPLELWSLREDMFVDTTSFFRDPQVFECLRRQMLPEILSRKSAAESVRIWVPGCSSGEEVYSIAIVFLELMNERSSWHPIQISGSDVSEKSIEKAHRGTYTDSAMRGVSTERRRQYFNQRDGLFHVDKAVRNICSFVRHDLPDDPPVSNLDLVSCRNVLSQFERGLQRKVVSALHYSLDPSGYLVLGLTEKLPDVEGLFVPFDVSKRIFARVSASNVLRFTRRAGVDAVAAQAPVPPMFARCGEADFLSQLSHELRTPSASMRRFARALRSGDMSRAALEERIGSLERGARIQGQWIEDLLDVSRMLTGRLALTSTMVDFCAEIETVLGEHRESMLSKELQLNIDLDASIGEVWADPARVRQIMTHLLINAIQFTPPHGRVTVSAERVERHIWLRVLDTGIGIEPALLPDVFNRFAKRAAPLAYGQGGLGLGLVIVQHLVALHGGSVFAASPGVAQGATFSVYLPRLPEPVRVPGEPVG